MVPLGTPSLTICTSSSLRLITTPPQKSGSPLAWFHGGPRFSGGRGVGGGRVPSAVERLEADKAKYVKSQQVINNRQEPAWRGYSPRSSPRSRRLLSRCHDSCPASELHRDVPLKLLCPQTSPVSRRAGGRRLLRPDSLLIHRQKWGGDKENNAKGTGLMRQLFQGSLRDKPPISPPGVGQRGVSPTPQHPQTPMVWVAGEKEEETMGGDSYGGTEKGLSVPLSSPLLEQEEEVKMGGDSDGDTKKGMSLPLSLPLSEQEKFFNSCGLEQGLVELLGQERFGPVGWDNSSAQLPPSCESEPRRASRGSEDEDEDEEESDTRSPAVSVVERNARVIKWLYGCQRARAATTEATV
ncbi:F110D protein, partial [Turnix velox]|nr:F110D protein [Turnix velox]